MKKFLSHYANTGDGIFFLNKANYKTRQVFLEICWNKNGLTERPIENLRIGNITHDMWSKLKKVSDNTDDRRWPKHLDDCLIHHSNENVVSTGVWTFTPAEMVLNDQN